MPDFSTKNLLGCELEVRKGSLLQQSDLDAIVIPANKQLTLGWGSHIAEAVLKQGGKELEEEAIAAGKELYPRGCPLGGAVLTGGGKLPFKNLIHAAVLDKYDMNPLFLLKLRQRTSDTTLTDAVCSSLSRAEESGVRSVGFSLMGAGIGGMNSKKCSHILIRTCEQYLSAEHSKLTKVVFSALKEKDAEILHQTLHETV